MTLRQQLCHHRHESGYRLQGPAGGFCKKNRGAGYLGLGASRCSFPTNRGVSAHFGLLIHATRAEIRHAPSREWCSRARARARVALVSRDFPHGNMPSLPSAMLAVALLALAANASAAPPLVFDTAAYTLRGSLGLKVKPNEATGQVVVTGFSEKQASKAAAPGRCVGYWCCSYGLPVLRQTAAGAGAATPSLPLSPRLTAFRWVCRRRRGLRWA